ncbi:MAG TPA: sensor histidine kinase [Pseudonocardiaceae bacterium]|nr:sensor histidine kinase [Pseudonocardiaceae bacterium]
MTASTAGSSTADEESGAARSSEVTLAGQAAAGWPGIAWLRDRLNRHPMLADACFALLLMGLLGSRGSGNFRGAELVGQHDAVGLTLGLVLCAALIWRRRYPLTVFCFMCVVAATQWSIGLVLVADAALLVGLYTIAAHCPRRPALVAGGVLEAGILGAVIRWTPPPGMLTSFIFLSGMALAAFVLGVNIQTRRAYLASLEDRTLRAERERDQQSQIAAASERTRIAREMHDIVAHNLSVMIALADGAAFAARTGSPDAERAARQVSDTGRGALTEMQRLLGVLRGAEPTTLRAPQPGVEQLDDLVNQVRSAGLPTSLTISGAPFPLSATVALAIYRVTQEALTNVLKHATAPTEATVRLRYDDPVIELSITDNGSGGAKGGRTVGGHGLTGMRERVALFDGTLDVGPTPAGGWRVHAWIGGSGQPEQHSSEARIDDAAGSGNSG